MNNIPNRFYRISAKALILNETRDKFLIAKANDGKWDLVGGGINWGETGQEALVREIKEEMGIDVQIDTKTPAYFFTSKTSFGMWSSNVLYETVLERLDFIESEECVEVMFVKVEELNDLSITSNLREFGKYFYPENHR